MWSRLLLWAIQEEFFAYFTFYHIVISIHILFRSNITADEYVYNPINAFHLLLRNAIWLPKLFPNDPTHNILSPNGISNIMEQVAFGIVDIQEFYDLDVKLVSMELNNLPFCDWLFPARGKARHKSRVFPQHQLWIVNIISVMKP